VPRVTGGPTLINQILLKRCKKFSVFLEVKKKISGCQCAKEIDIFPKYLKKKKKKS